MINDKNSPNHLQFLLSQSAFQGIDVDSHAFAKFITEISLTRFYKNDIIYKENSPSNTIYVVRDGEIYLTRNYKSDKQIIDSKHGRGSMFGEVSFLNADKHTTTAIADLDSHVYCIPGKSLLKLMEVESSVGPAIARLVAWRLHRNVKKEFLHESPARIHTIFYPDNAKRCHTISYLLAEALVRENPGPVLLLQFNQHCPSGKASKPHLEYILNSWPDVKLSDVLLNTNAQGNSFDVLSGSFIHKADFNSTKASKIIPAFLGRLKKYYSAILIDAGSDCQNPVIAKAINQSDHILLIKNHIGQEFSSRWNSTYQFCQKALGHSVAKIISIDDHVSGFGKNESHKNKIMNPFSKSMQEHYRIESRNDDLHEALSQRSFRKGLYRISRAISGTSRGICFGGGGARAFAHIGVIDELEKAGIDFDIVVGASMGAIIGAAYANGLDALEIEKTVSAVLPNAAALIDKNIPVISYYRANKLNKAIKKAFGDMKFEDLEIPFLCNGCDLISGSQLIFESGFLAPALRGSVSLPGIFPPYKYGNYKIVDGGVINNLPGEILRQKKCTRILGINVSPLQDPTSSHTSIESRQGSIFHKVKDYFSIPPILKIINRSISIQGIELLKLRIHDQDLVLHPNVAKYDLFDFHRIKEIVESGRQCAIQYKKEIKKSLKKLKINQ